MAGPTEQEKSMRRKKKQRGTVTKLQMAEAICSSLHPVPFRMAGREGKKTQE